ncbi:Sporulation kinase A [Anatilimnocola aggregata]|uniref:histidine kinase n=1 Tax=Anatilimnocola aggregata TaxID=2528021 RepID=A0A517YNE0_9BACT|nr:HAMP domain-containing sensor histidine kinase [Anatilimnocola aggregata]QDU31747.1 Sporulation kinase A [Anatilimnocola aggregata]
MAQSDSELLYTPQDLEREKLAALKQFAYGLSHEINNPLTNIATRAQMLLVDEHDPARRKALATINAQAFRAFEMLADLMLFAHPPALVPTTFSLCELLSQLNDEQAAIAEAQRTDLQFAELPSDVDSITADRTQLAAALSALIKNALEALKTGGEILVTAASYQTTDQQGIELVVADNGPGITPEVRRHLFDPFFSGREAGRGLGLGLSKAYRIAEMHGGQLTVDSQPSHGARFALRLPQ